jgi:hypothetical protein
MSNAERVGEGRMNRVTFECDGNFRGDSGPTIVFYRDACVERVRWETASKESFDLTLDQFVKVLRAAGGRGAVSNPGGSDTNG